MLSTLDLTHVTRFLYSFFILLNKIQFSPNISTSKSYLMNHENTIAGSIFTARDHCPIIPFSLQLILICKLILDFWKEKHNQGMIFKFNFATIYLFMQKAKLMTRLAPSNVNYQWHTRLQFLSCFWTKIYRMTI